MKALYRSLSARQSDKNIAGPIADLRTPKCGWVRTIREAIGMTERQFARRLNVTPQAANALETAEAAGAITLTRLHRAAEALDCRLVYAFVPRKGSLEAMIGAQAEIIAARLVAEVEKTMALEDQQRDPETLRQEIRARAAELSRLPDKSLWEID